MTSAEAKQLFAYGGWANGMFVRVAEGLTQEQLEAKTPGSFPSILGTLAHIVGAEWVWLRRWLGVSPAALPPWVATPGLSELKVKLASVEAERASFLADLADVDLDRVISYQTLSGQAFSDTLGDLIRHVVNHSTYHRGQLAAQLRDLGQTPPSTDLIRYVRASK